MYRSLGALALLMSVGACSENPCDVMGACEVSGVDLYVVSAVANSSEMDTDTGLRVLRAESIRFNVTIANRGDETSDSAHFELSVPHAEPVDVAVGALGPGESRVIPVVTRAVDNPFSFFSVSTLPSPADSVQGIIRIVAADADSSNNVAKTDAFRLGLPIIGIDLDSFPAEALANQPFSAVVRVRNISPYGTLPAHALGFCLFDEGDRDWGCLTGQGFTGSVGAELPALAPGEEFVLRQVTLTSTAADEFRANEYVVGGCLAASGTDSAGFASSEVPRHCSGFPVVLLRPDYSHCEPVVLVPDVVSHAPSTCRTPQPFYAYILDAEAGMTYTLHNADGSPETAGIYTPDGEPVRHDESDAPGLQFETKRYYVLDFLASSEEVQPTGSLLLRAEPSALAGNRR
jgi:hypothetical protein